MKQDVLGRPIQVGDIILHVIIAGYAKIHWGVVLGMKPNTIQLLSCFKYSDGRLAPCKRSIGYVKSRIVVLDQQQYTQDMLTFRQEQGV